eukprot:CAMPEP_0170469642 /NCGR_PEP_ID=MMETSP0123-20130129/12407_1 /TAXON_ID=182087 /ORGANISM="Favella ehrenbergii, Strain Fehren 1" /LENGTH=40 /DNA_ID= /DNA_START= /DNA_END= /DNA_ORIENTATION=
MGNKSEKRQMAAQFGSEGQHLVEIRKARDAEERKRDMTAT